jgi:hypothetical protein
MKRIIVPVVLSMVAAVVLVGCGGGGGGGVGTNANATPPTVLNAGVTKDVSLRNPGFTVGDEIRSFTNFTGEITVSGNMISLTDGGKNQVFVGWTMIAVEK